MQYLSYISIYCTRQGEVWGWPGGYWWSFQGLVSYVWAEWSWLNVEWIPSHTLSNFKFVKRVVKDVHVSYKGYRPLHIISPVIMYMYFCVICLNPQSTAQNTNNSYDVTCEVLIIQYTVVIKYSSSIRPIVYLFI